MIDFITPGEFNMLVETRYSEINTNESNRMPVAYTSYDTYI